MLIFLRHCNTEFNVANRWIGSLDIPLSPQGRIEASKLAEELSEFEFTKIFSSSLIRAEQTAIEIVEKQNRADLIILDLLQERSLGKFEGQKKTLLKRKQLNSSITVEPIELFQKRINDAMSLISNSENTLIVSHSGVFRSLIQNLGYVSKPKLTTIKNGQYVELLN